MTNDPEKNRTLPGWKSALASQEFGLILANLVAWLAILLLDPQYNFASIDSARLLLREGVLLGIYAIGAAIVIVAGGIDLSTGSVIAFSGVVCALLLQAFGGESLAAHQPLPFWVIVTAIVLTLFVGLLIGLFHTVLIRNLDLPPFIATLGTLAGLRSLAKVLSNDAKISANNDTFRALYTVWWVPALIFLLVAIGAALLMRRSVAGRHLYALGGNEEAARLSGLRASAASRQQRTCLRRYSRLLPGFSTPRDKVRVMPKVRWVMNSARSQQRLWGAATCAEDKERLREPSWE